MFQIRFEWKGKEYPATVTPDNFNGVAGFLVQVEGRKPLTFIPNGYGGWSCLPWYGYEITNCIGREIDKAVKNELF